MKHSFLITLFMTVFLLPACSSQPAGDAWTTYHAASDTLVNPDFAAYSFEYPSYWELREDPNHITFASEAQILESMPAKLQPGQIVGGLTIRVNMPPEEVVEGYTTGLADKIEFDEMIFVRLNGRPAAYQEGTNPETNDAVFVLAVDMGEETRGLLTARTAAGEFETWEEVLFKMAGSLQVE